MTFPPAPSSPSSNRCLATSLPFELIDRIITYRLATKCDYGYHFVPYVNPKSLALVCRAWRAPVQRRLLKNISWKGYNHRKLQDLANDLRANQQFASYIRSLTVDVGYSSNTWTVEELGHVLRALPHLTSLALLTVNIEADFSELEEMPLLEHLQVRGNAFDKESDVYREILAVTPNITSLALGNDKSLCYALSSSECLVPVHLPKLTSLALTGAQFTRLFEKLRLLSPETMGQINDISFDDVGQRHRKLHKFSPTTFLATLGRQIKTLRLPEVQMAGVSTLDLVAACPVVETLFIRDNFEFPSTLPITVHMIVCESYRRTAESSVYLEQRLHRSGVNLSNVKKLDYRRGTAMDGLKKICRENAIVLSDIGGKVEL